MRLIRSKAGLAALSVVSCLLIYALFWSGVHYSIDGIIMFEYAKALVFQHSFSMNPPVKWNNMDITVSKWGIGQTLAYIPALWILSRTIFSQNPSFTQIPYNPDLPSNPRLLENTAYLSVSYLNAFFTTATVLVLFLLLIDLGFTKRKASIVALIFGLASPAAAYAKFDFAQPLAALCLLISFWLLNKAQKTDHNRYLFLSGISLGALVLTRTELLILQFPVMIVAVFLIGSKGSRIFSFSRSKIWKIVIFCLPIFFIAGINQYLNYMRFGEWFAVGYDFETMFRPDIVALLGNLISPGRGLFLFFPFAWLSILSLKRLKGNIILWAMFISAFGAILFYSIFNWGWAAGLCWGPRFLVPYIPYFAILGLIGFEEINARFYKLSNVLFVILTVLGGIFSLQGLLFNFLNFYGLKQVTDQDLLNGLYNFSVRYSPVLSGWGGLFSPKGYDIYWLQHPLAFNGGSQIVLLSLGIALGVILSIWATFFTSQNS